MVSRLHRLRKRADVLRTIRHGRRLKTPDVLFYIYRRGEGQAPRVACIVGKKVSKSAVRRHTRQRWLREIARELVTTASPKYDMVLLALPSLNRISSLTDLKESVTPCLPAVRQYLVS